MFLDTSRPQSPWRPHSPFTNRASSRAPWVWTESLRENRRWGPQWPSPHVLRLLAGTKASTSQLMRLHDACQRVHVGALRVVFQAWKEGHWSCFSWCCPGGNVPGLRSSTSVRSLLGRIYCTKLGGHDGSFPRVLHWPCPPVCHLKVLFLLSFTALLTFTQST